MSDVTSPIIRDLILANTDQYIVAHWLEVDCGNDIVQHGDMFADGARSHLAGTRHTELV
jgi:hypothetical protein